MLQLNQKQRTIVIILSLLFLVPIVGSACEEVVFESSIPTIDWGATPKENEIDPRVPNIQEAIEDGEYQRAIDLVIELYEIDTSAVNGVPTYDSAMLGAVTNSDGTVFIGHDVYTSPGLLATVVSHEAFHAQQLADDRWFLEHEEQGWYMNEVEAYAWNLSNAEDYGLTNEEIEDLQNRYNFYYELLLPEYQELVDHGIYDLPPLEEP